MGSIFSLVLCANSHANSHAPSCHTGDLVQLLGIFNESVGVLHVTAPVEILDDASQASIAVRPVVYHLGNSTAEALTVAALSGASYAIRSISFIISYCGRTSDISAAVGGGGQSKSGTCLHAASSLVNINQHGCCIFPAATPPRLAACCA
jgi:hypothetical protein